MMPINASGSAWQSAAVIIVVACSVFALLCHLLPSLASRLQAAAGKGLQHRLLPAPFKKLGKRLDAIEQSATCKQGCGPCAGCGTHSNPPGVMTAATSPESQPATRRRLPPIVQEPYCGESGKAQGRASPEGSVSIDTD